MAAKASKLSSAGEQVRVTAEETVKSRGMQIEFGDHMHLVMDLIVHYSTGNLVHLRIEILCLLNVCFFIAQLPVQRFLLDFRAYLICYPKRV